MGIKEMRGSMTRTRIDPRTNGSDRSKKAKTVHRARIAEEDARVSRAIFTLGEAAGYLGIPKSTLQRWARGSDGEPLITTFDVRGHEATVPFIGFAEAYVLSAFRRAGVPMQRIRPAIEALTSSIGVEHALASETLYTDGAEVLVDFAANRDDSEFLELVVARTGQRQFTE